MLWLSEGPRGWGGRQHDGITLSITTCAKHRFQRETWAWELPTYFKCNDHLRRQGTMLV